MHQVQFKSDMIDRILPLCSTIVILDAYEGGSLEPTFYHPRVLGKVTNFNGRTSVRRDMLKLLTKETFMLKQEEHFPNLEVVRIANRRRRGQL